MTLPYQGQRDNQEWMLKEEEKKMTPGQAAFEKWQVTQNWESVNGWEQLNDERKQAWEEIAEAAAMVYIEQHDMYS